MNEKQELFLGEEVFGLQSFIIEAMHASKKILKNFQAQKYRKCFEL